MQLITRTARCSLVDWDWGREGGELPPSALFRSAALLLLSVLLLVPLRQADAAIAASRHSVMVAFIYNFTSFIDWPDEPPYNEGPFVIAGYKENPYQELFSALSRRDVGGRPIVVKTIKSLDDAAGAIHMLFVAQQYEDEMPDLYRELNGRATLTIGESDNFTRRGGMVRFFEDRDNLRVEINHRLTDEASLSIRARLLRLASRVNHRAPR